jgi:hypothetical protein
MCGFCRTSYKRFTDSFHTFIAYTHRGLLRPVNTSRVSLWSAANRMWLAQFSVRHNFSNPRRDFVDTLHIPLLCEPQILHSAGDVGDMSRRPVTVIAALELWTGSFQRATNFRSCWNASSLVRCGPTLVDVLAVSEHKIGIHVFKIFPAWSVRSSVL